MTWMLGYSADRPDKVREKFYYHYHVFTACRKHACWLEIDDGLDEKSLRDSTTNNDIHKEDKACCVS